MDSSGNELRTPISFEQIREVVTEFMHLLNEKGYIHIITEYMVKEFRDYYSPNIPYTLHTDNDQRLFIKNGIFKIEFSEMMSPPHYIYVDVIVNDTRNTVKDKISLREFLYVYCNPEGLHLIEKVSFIINNTDFEQAEAQRNEDLGIDPNMTNYDYEDEIPF
jgi:hypothetical protein